MIQRRTLIAGSSALVAGAAALAISRHRFGLGKGSIEGRARSIGEQNGILIGYGTPATFFVPPYSARDATIAHGTATAADIAFLGPALDGIEQSLRVYPPGFFSRMCGAIFLCGSLILDGAPAGGTYGPAWIILAAPPGLSDDGIFRTAYLGVHHEFSSLIWHHIPDVIAAWRLLMPPGWKPSANNAISLQAANAPAPDPASGFLSAYAATDAENDFNVYAETVFTDAAMISRLAERHPIVAKKAALLMAAFSLLDYRLNGVFDQSGLGRFRAAFQGSLSEGVAVPKFDTPVPTVVFPGDSKRRP